jgi:hypothetical protein
MPARLAGWPLAVTLLPCTTNGATPCVFPLEDELEVVIGVDEDNLELEVAIGVELELEETIGVEDDPLTILVQVGRAIQV